MLAEKNQNWKTSAKIYFLLVILILCEEEILEPSWNSQEIFENSQLFCREFH